MSVVILERALWQTRHHGWRHVFHRLVEKVRQSSAFSADMVYLTDCICARDVDISADPAMVVTAHATRADVPDAFVEELAKRKGGRPVAEALLQHFFDKRGVLWVAAIDGRPVGYHWTIQSGIDGFFFRPLVTDETVIYAADVFPEFRGRGIWPALVRRTFRELRNQGARRFHICCKEWNKASHRVIVKCGFAFRGFAREFSLVGRHIVIWRRADARPADALNLT
jgi:GNAT superfamily N-acetyltransferase